MRRRGDQVVSDQEAAADYSRNLQGSYSGGFEHGDLLYEDLQCDDLQQGDLQQQIAVANRRPKWSYIGPPRR
jgi:hypothetical protein